MATLTVQTLGSGSAVTFQAAAGGGDQFANDGKNSLWVKNGGGSPITVTIDAPGQCNFGVSANAAHDLAVSVAAGETRVIRPTDTARFNDANNMAQVSYSGVTSVEVAAVKLS